LNQFSSFPLNSIFYTHLFKIAGPPIFQARTEALSRGGQKKTPYVCRKLLSNSIIQPSKLLKDSKKMHNPEPKP
jgi:hypothetical protein